MESEVPGVAPASIPAERQGCAKNALIGCGVAALLVLALIVGCFLYLRRNPTILTDLMMRQIETHYGADVTEQDKAQLRAAYAEFRAAVRERKINRAAVDRLQTTLSSNRSNQLNQQQVRALTEAFREGAGKTAVAPLPSGSPISAATPTP